MRSYNSRNTNDKLTVGPLRGVSLYWLDFIIPSRRSWIRHRCRHAVSPPMNNKLLFEGQYYRRPEPLIHQGLSHFPLCQRFEYQPYIFFKAFMHSSAVLLSREPLNPASSKNISESLLQAASVFHLMMRRVKLIPDF